MKKGKLYKSAYKNACNGLVVKCTKDVHGCIFSGVVVERGESEYLVGQHYNGWFCPAFKEYIPTQVLTEGVTYDIPEGFKATIKNRQVLIESNTKYYKHEFEGFVRYGKHVEDGRTTIITLDCNGNTEISHIGERPCPDISGRVKEIDENEFTNAYNTALKNLEL